MFDENICIEMAYDEDGSPRIDIPLDFIVGCLIEVHGEELGGVATAALSRLVARIKAEYGQRH